MGLFGKSRKTIILNATQGLAQLFYSKIMDLGNDKKITKYEQDVLVWATFGARGFTDSLLNQEGYPLNKISDNQLGIEGNALNAYYKMIIFLLYLHEQRISNKKELKNLADTSINDISKTLDEMLSLENGYVRNYLEHLRELHAKSEGKTMEVFQYQMVDATKDLMADGRNVNELFDDPASRIFLPMAFNIQLIEQANALDKLLGLEKE